MTTLLTQIEELLKYVIIQPMPEQFNIRYIGEQIVLKIKSYL